MNFCKLCNEPIKRRLQYCDDCRKRVYQARNKNMAKGWSTSQKTKGELFSSRKNWQSARSCIRKHAVYIYYKNNLPNHCSTCGYKKHIDICHLKPVCDFSDETLISEINSPANLIGLCPNCHWELDHISETRS